MKRAFLICLMCFSFSAQAGFNEAVKNYEEGNYQEALLEFQSLAEIGNKSAQYNLGFMYLDGLGTKQDLVKAYAWIKLSNEEEQAVETRDVLKQIKRHLKEKKKEIADSLYSKLYELYGKSSIVSELKPVFEQSSGFKYAKPLKTTLPLYPVSAAYSSIEGYARAEFLLDENGKAINIEIVDSFPYGIFDNTTKDAIKLWEFDVSNSNVNAIYSYRIEFKMSGSAYSSKTRNKVKRYKKLAVKGDPVGQFYYAKYGSLVLNDDVNETEMFYQSAVQGLVDSQHELGMRLLSGNGCTKDETKGLRWLVTAAASDFGRSQLKLSDYYSRIQGEDAKRKSSFWLEKAIHSKDKESALLIANRIADSNFSPHLVINKLDLLDAKKVKDPIRYYILYAESYAKLKDFSNASKYQSKANKAIKKYRRVPEEMKERLKYYESQQALN